MSTDNEKLIKEARLFADRDNGLNWQGRIRELADALEAAEKAHTPTDDEREALARVVAKADEETLDYERRLPDYYADPWEGYLLHADYILAAGFRRSEVSHD